MSSINAPFGLRPAFHPSGVIRPVAGSIASGYNTNIFMNSPIAALTDGTIAMAAAGARALGAFQGVEYNPTATGPRVVSNMWPANQTTTVNVAYYTQDPNTVYEIQANATLTAAAIGDQYDWSTNNTNSGNTVTGLSSVTLDVATAAGAGANAGLRVIGLTPGPDNAWGDSFPIVQVQISEHQYVADRVAI